jgi:DNA invertase Pin-like site-specific DNA recombinase
VHGYIRTSRPPKRQARHGSSGAPLGIESQRAAILERFPDARLWVDQFQSGRRSSRPALREMISQLARGDLVVVVRLDRLARSFRLAVALEHEIEDRRGARLVSLAGEGTSADGPPDPYAVFVRRIHHATAELQVAQAARSTREALAVRKGNGYAATGSAPWGYRLARGRLVPDAREQEVLAIARAFLARCVSSPVPADLARVLAKAGARNRRGGGITRDTAGRIMRQLAAEQIEKPPRKSRAK